MPNIVFDRSDLSVFTRRCCLGLEVTGHRTVQAHSVSACRITCDDRRYLRRGRQGEACDKVFWRLVHEPHVWAVH